VVKVLENNTIIMKRIYWIENATCNKLRNYVMLMVAWRPTQSFWGQNYGFFASLDKYPAVLNGLDIIFV